MSHLPRQDCIVERATAPLPHHTIHSSLADGLHRAAGFVPHSFRPLPPTPPDSDVGRRKAHSGCHTRLRECPDLAVQWTDSWLLGAVEKKGSSLELPVRWWGPLLLVATMNAPRERPCWLAGGRGGLRFSLRALTPPLRSLVLTPSPAGIWWLRDVAGAQQQVSTRESAHLYSAGQPPEHLSPTGHQSFAADSEIRALLWGRLLSLQLRCECEL